MGALHAGHASLVQRAVRETDCAIASIFVNPTQFNNTSDFEKYPTSVESDINMLRELSCTAVFLPSLKTMYPEGTQLSNFQISFGALESTMEGAHRPGHFRGVGMVVSKLFHMVVPDVAYFGQKDYQQYLIIRQLVQALSFPVEVRCCPIIREENGLAMSSRNRRLTIDQQQEAGVLYRALQTAAALLQKGEQPQKAVSAAKALIETVPTVQLEYLHIANAHNLQLVDALPLPSTVLIAIAAHVGEVRLIDNHIVEIHSQTK